MVLKPLPNKERSGMAFYSSVILNGTETVGSMTTPVGLFYSSVILNGTETWKSLLLVK